jgi:ParB family chromosome partitioning protein
MKSLGLHQITVAQIDFGTRLRQVSEDHAALLAANIAEVGRLRSPIEVRKTRKADQYTLIAGGHRLRAVQSLGWAEIDAFVFDLTDDEARLAEIDENLIRHELNPLDRAVFLAERKELYLRLHPETAAGTAGAEAKHGRATDIMSFAADTAERCGLTERSIRRAVAIAVGLKAGARARIAGTWLAAKQGELLALTRASESEQHKALDLLLATPAQAKTVEAALKMVRGVVETAKSEDDVEFEKLVKAWLRASGPVRRRFLDEVINTQAETA